MAVTVKALKALPLAFEAGVQYNFLELSTTALVLALQAVAFVLSVPMRTEPELMAFTTKLLTVPSSTSVALVLLCSIAAVISISVSSVAVAILAVGVVRVGASLEAVTSNLI